MIRILTLAAILFASPAFAAEQLMPEPYPGQLGVNAQESQPSGLGGSAHQELVPEPAPQAEYVLVSLVEEGEDASIRIHSGIDIPASSVMAA